MVSTTDYVRMARRLDGRGLRALWRRIERGDTPGWPPGRALEHLVMRAFELDGADVRWPYEVRSRGMLLEQIDGVVRVGPINALIETKDQCDPVNVEPLAKMRNQLLRRPAGTIGVIFSSSGFTEPARILAEYMAPTTVLLWSDTDLHVALESPVSRPFVRGLQWKYQMAVEEGEASSRFGSVLEGASP